jgi:hypothetical protein
MATLRIHSQSAREPDVFFMYQLPNGTDSGYNKGSVAARGLKEDPSIYSLDRP